MSRPVTDRRAAVGLASAAFALDGTADLLAVLEATGLISPAPPARSEPRKRRPELHSRESRRRMLRPWVLADPCPVGACRNAASSPGVPCPECLAALDGYLRRAGDQSGGAAATEPGRAA